MAVIESTTYCAGELRMVVKPGESHSYAWSTMTMMDPTARVIEVIGAGFRLVHWSDKWAVVRPDHSIANMGTRPVEVVA